jgi:hypothetical protein
VPVSYGKELPPELLSGGQSCLFVDFCPELAQLEQLQTLWRDWFVIDHHVSRDWIVRQFPRHCAFDLERSGAALVHEWLWPMSQLPILLCYVQDRDLWRWKLPNSREVSAALRDLEPDVDTWRRTLFDHPVPPADLVAVGKVILRQVERYARARAKKAWQTSQPGEPVMRVVNATQHMSEVAETILELWPDTAVAAIFWCEGPEEISWSFRSRPGAGLSALSVAQRLGGGGHEHAAGAKVRGGLVL